MKKLLSYLAIFLVIGFFFSPLILKGQLPVPSDALIGLYHPYRDYYSAQYSRGFPFKNFLITDPVRQQIPWRNLSIVSLKNFQIPLWNPYSGAGEPLLANMQSAVFNPLNVLFFLFPFKIGWSLIIVFQMIFGAVFFYWYVRNLGLQKIPALFGAISFIFSGFFIAWLEWGTLTMSLVYLPLILLSTDKIFENNLKKKKFIWSLILIFSFCSSFFSGHEQIFLYVGFVSLAYFFLRFITNHQKAKNIWYFIISGAVFLVFTSIIWVPALQFINLSSRSSEVLWKTTEGWFIPISQLIQFISPDFFGNPATLNYFGTWNYGEMVGYIGVVGLLFSFLAIIFERKKEVYFFTSIVFLGLVLATNNLISNLPFELNVPLISLSQPTRILSIIDFSLCVLAGYGLQKFIQSKKSAIVPVFLLGLIFLGLWIFVKVNSSDSNILISQRNLIFPSILFLITSVLILTVSVLRSLDSKYLSLFLFLFIVISVFDGIRFAQKFTPFVSQQYFYPTTKTISFLKQEIKNYPWRVMSVDVNASGKTILPPNILDYYNIQTPDTYNSFILKDYENFISLSEFGYKVASFNRIISPNKYSSNLINLLGVKYVSSLIPIENKQFKLIFQEGQTKTYENLSAYPRAFMVYNLMLNQNANQISKDLLNPSINLRDTAVIDRKIALEPINNPSGIVKITSYESNAVKLSVQTNSPGILLLTDNYYPTWTVFVDNKKGNIYKTDLTFRGVYVPKGNHIVVFIDNIF